MKKIYIVVSNSGSIVSKFLRLFTHNKYVHVTISLDKFLNEAYSFGRKFTYSPLPGGFINEMYEKRCKHFNKSESKIFELKVSNKQYKKLKDILEQEYMNNKKYKYNIIGLYYIYRNKAHHRDFRLVCSQFCGKVLIECDIVSFDKDYSLIRPTDFLDLKGTSLIFEGRTMDYINYKKRVINY